MPLDDDIARFLRAQEALDPPQPWEVSLDEARAASRRPYEGRDRTPVASVLDDALDGPGGPIPVRVHRPEGTAPHPGVVYLHGGGWVLGDLDTHDEAARRLCAGAGAVVVSVDYRRAPEHPFPAAVEDALAGTRWTAEGAAALGIDPSRLVVAGDSAGGNLAAVVARRLRDEGGPPLAGQLLIYPATDLRPGGYPSRTEVGDGYGLTQEAMDWFARAYLGHEDVARDPDASPLLAPSLADLPPALVAVCEFDPLRDEGLAYAERLREAGVPVEAHRLEGAIHGIFTNPEEFAAGRRLWGLALDWLRRTVGARGEAVR